MKTNSFPKDSTNKKFAVIGLIFLFPLCFFLLSVFLKYGLKINFLFDSFENIYAMKPVEIGIVLSPLVSLILNLYAVVRLKASSESGDLNINFNVKLKVLNIAVVFASACLLLIVACYGIAENLHHQYGITIKLI